MTVKMKKSTAIQLIAGKKGKAVDLAKALNLDKSTVSKWPDDAIPELRALQVKELARQMKLKKQRKAKAKKES